MRDKIHKIGKSLWDYANSNIGGALVASSATYILTKGSTEAELATAKTDLDRSTQANKELETELRASNNRISMLLESKTDMLSELNKCQMSRLHLKNAYDSSICLFKPSYTEERIDAKVANKFSK